MLTGEFSYDAVAPNRDPELPLLRVTVDRRGREMHAQITVESPDGKTLSDSEMHDRVSCMALSRSAALGAVIDAERVLKAVPPRSAKPPTAPASGSPKVTVITSANTASPAQGVEEASSDRSPLGSEFSFSTIVGVGVLPITGFGIEASAGLRSRDFTLSLDGRFLATPHFSVTTDRAATSLLGMGMIRACGHLPAPVSFLEVCPLAGAGRIVVTPVKNDNAPKYTSVDTHAFTVIAGVRALAGWQPRSGVYLKVFAEGDAAPVWTGIRFNGTQRWHVPTPISGVFGIQVSLVPKQPKAWYPPRSAQARLVP